MKALSEKIAAAVLKNGPMNGKQISACFPEVSALDLWRATLKNPNFRVANFASYYLRYDITRADYIRLSPSILRDFLSFTLIYLPSQQEEAIVQQVNLANQYREISLKKISLARDVLLKALDIVSIGDQARICAILAGDLAYFLGHEEPREVPNTGELVRGSDIDIIIIHDGLPQTILNDIDRALLQEKNFYLRHPDYRHELDFISKSIDILRCQFEYNSIHDKIASKIVYEAMFLGGSLKLFQRIQKLLVETGARGKIRADFEFAVQDRNEAMRNLLTFDGNQLDDNTRSLFYFSEERIEFQ